VLHHLGRLGDDHQTLKSNKRRERTGRGEKKFFLRREGQRAGPRPADLELVPRSVQKKTQEVKVAGAQGSLRGVPGSSKSRRRKGRKPGKFAKREKNRTVLGET